MFGGFAGAGDGAAGEKVHEEKEINVANIDNIDGPVRVTRTHRRTVVPRLTVLIDYSLLFSYTRRLLILHHDMLLKITINYRHCWNSGG